MAIDYVHSSIAYPQSIMLFSQSFFKKNTITSLDIYASKAGWFTFGVG